jgi:hypothetical protein
MASRSEDHFNQGWGFASFITLLVVLAFVVAFTVNRRTHYSPNNVTAPTGAASTSAPAVPSRPH